MGRGTGKAEVTQTDENPVAGEPIGDLAGMVSGHAPDGACLYGSPESGLSGEDVYRHVLEHAVTWGTLSVPTAANLEARMDATTP